MEKIEKQKTIGKKRNKKKNSKKRDFHKSFEE